MGLDTTHDCWHGAYSAFSRWRNKLAEVAGYSIGKDEMGFEYPILNWDIYTEDNLAGKWKKTPTDPLLVLIVHYDSDGIIRPAQAKDLAKRLEGLLDKLPEEDDFGHIGNWRDKTKQFIKGLKIAVKRGENVEFH